MWGNTKETLEVYDFLWNYKNITYEIIENEIIVTPRPFCTEKIKIMLYGCLKESYPKQKIVSWILYTIKKDQNQKTLWTLQTL